MLWKLLKYDFRAMWKQFSIVWLAALVVALVNRLTLIEGIRTATISAWLLGGAIHSITSTVFIGVLFAVFIIAMVFILKRFYQGLLGAEGYLMHTLPVHTWQLIASKLICAVFVTVISVIVAILASVLLVPTDWSELFRGELWQMLFQGLAKHPDTLLYLAEFCLVLLAWLVMGITMLYLSMALGHLFQRRRVLMSVAAFFVLNIVYNLYHSAAATVAGRIEFYDLLQNDAGHLELWLAILSLLVPAALFFFAASYILSTRLNLE